MEHFTVAAVLKVTLLVTLICASNGQSDSDSDSASDIVSAACTWCFDYSDDEACAVCNSGELGDLADLDKRSGFYRSQRSSCHCCFLSRFTNSICCNDCNRLTSGLSKRSEDSVLYHPLFRGGFPKKSTMYNPLLRGLVKRHQRFNPILRGGSNGLYTYSPSDLGFNKKSLGFYNPLLRGYDKRSSGDFQDNRFMLNPLLRGGYIKKSNFYHPLLRGGSQMPGGETID